MEFGVLAGYPMVDVKFTLEDGAYHDVDSSELAFKIAGNAAFKEAARMAKPVLLEPMFAVEVTTPETYMGDVIGDINSRRGQVQSMDERSGDRVIEALVPLSEMFGYVGDLRSKTSGQASYSMEFDSYAEVPKNVAEEIIKKVRGEWFSDSHTAPQQTSQVPNEEEPPWLRRSSSGLSRTSTSAPSVTSTMARRR